MNQLINWYSRHHVKLGVIGLSITLALNLLAGDRFFTTSWWSRWLPSYIAWLVVAMLGVRPRRSDNKERPGRP
jgi:hypothetical protein